MPEIYPVAFAVAVAVVRDQKQSYGRQIDNVDDCPRHLNSRGHAFGGRRHGRHVFVLYIEELIILCTLTQHINTGGEQDGALDYIPEAGLLFR